MITGGGISPLPIFREPLAKRFIFYFPTGGGKAPESPGAQKGKIMRRIAAIVLSLLMVLSLAACGQSAAPAQESVPSGVEDGVLTIAMECAYAPYNWAQKDDSNGAVPIANAEGYANGYDVMIAKRICEANGWQLEVLQYDWDSLVPGVQTGTFDAVIAGQSMTVKRSEQVDFAGPYFYASIVCLTRADSPYASAQGLSDLAGGTCTAQSATIWYDDMLPQIPNANIVTGSESAPAMLMALETGAVDFVCTDMPTALGAVAAYDDLVLLDFSAGDDNFDADEGEINIGVSVRKGNSELLNAINAVLDPMTADDFNALMDQAIAVQPVGA